VLLALVLTVVVSLGVVGLAVQAGAQQGIAGVRAGLGNEVRLATNFGAMRGSAAGELRQGGTLRMGAAPTVPEEWAARLAASPYVVEVNRTLRGWAQGVGIEPVTPDPASLPTGPGGRIIGMMQASTLTLVGGTLSSKIAEFSDGRRALVEGRLYTEAEVASAEPVAVIDQLLAAQNGLEVGSRFTLSDSASGRQVELLVIGISRDEASPDQTDVGGFSAMQLIGAGNQIYLPYTVVQQLNDRAGQLSSVSYYLDDPAHVEAFRAGATDAGLDTEQYTLWSSDAQFEVMAGPLVKLAGFSRAGVLAVVVAGAIIISLLMTLVTHERKLEIGVLRALGAGRRAVAGQFALETLMVCAVAVVLGLAVGAVVAQTAANVLLAREIAATQGQGMGRSLVMQGVNIFRIPGFGGAGAAMTQPQLAAAVGPQQLLAVAGIGLLLALCGSLVSAYWSMKLEPAAILAART
jgi:putative ABC transport system permease protein